MKEDSLCSPRAPDHNRTVRHGEFHTAGLLRSAIGNVKCSCTHTHHPVGHLRRTVQNCCLALYRTVSFAGTLGQCPQDWQVATNLQQLQELAADALTCSK